MVDDRTEWVGLAIGGPLDGQKARHVQPVLRVALHHDSPGLLREAIDPSKVTDYVYEHDAIFVQNDDKTYTEFGIWRPKNDDIEKSVSNLIDFYSERKSAGKKAANTNVSGGGPRLVPPATK